MLVPHIANGKLTISQANGSSSHAKRFSVVAIYENGEITQAYGGGLKPNWRDEVAVLARDFERYQAALKGIDRSDVNGAASVVQSDPKLQFIALLQASHLKSAIVFQTILSEYERQEPEKRFSAELSIDLYRQCFECLELTRGIAILTADLETKAWRIASRHQRECIFDAAYELYFRNRDMDAAMDYILKAFMVKKTPQRANALMELGRNGKKPKIAILAGEYLKKNAKLTLTQHAILGVAHANLKNFDMAMDSLAALERDSSQRGKDLAKKLGLYIEEQRHVPKP